MVGLPMLFARFNLLIMATTSLHAQTFGKHYENIYGRYYIDCQVQVVRDIVTSNHDGLPINNEASKGATTPSLKRRMAAPLESFLANKK
ncbi:hypothetical protein GQ457_01G043180 [Hibiscus cannabinus]